MSGILRVLFLKFLISISVMLFTSAFWDWGLTWGAVFFAPFVEFLDFMLSAMMDKAPLSIGSGVFGGKQLLGALSVYKATEKKQLKSYILEAIESFPDSQGIADQLDRYKNKYITSLFESSQSTGGVAGNIVASLAYYGSPMQYLNRAAQVQAVTAEDVALVYSRFLAQSKERAENQQPNPIHWVVVSGEEALRDFSFD